MPRSPRLRAGLGGLPSVFWILWGGVLLNRAASFVLGFLSLLLVGERGYAADAAGRVLALYGVGGVLAALLGGVLADRVGRRVTMVASLAANAAAVGALAWARAPGLVAGLTFLAGAAGQMYPPALNAAVADVVPFADHRRAFGLVYWASNVGFGIGFALAAAVSGRSVAALFVIDAGTTLAFALLVLLRVPETRPRDVAHPPPLAGLSLVLEDGTFLAFLGLALGGFLVFAQWELVFPLDLAAHGISRAQYAMLLWLNCAGAVVLQPLLGPMIRAWDASRALALSAILLGVGYGLNAFAAGLPWYVASVAVWTLGEVTGLPVAAALAASLAPPALRGRYQGAYSTVFAAAFMLSPWLSGELAARAGARTVWFTCLGVGAAVALGHLAAERARRERLAERARDAAGSAAGSSV